ncbi:MAG: hypothetical protein WDN76_03335 [Alphaproteobacteria bacterium]
MKQVLAMTPDLFEPADVVIHGGAASIGALSSFAPFQSILKQRVRERIRQANGAKRVTSRLLTLSTASLASRAPIATGTITPRLNCGGGAGVIAVEQARADALRVHADPCSAAAHIDRGEVGDIVCAGFARRRLHADSRIVAIHGQDKTIGIADEGYGAHFYSAA